MATDTYQSRKEFHVNYSEGRGESVGNDQLDVVRADLERRLAQRTRHVVLRRRVGPGLAGQLLAGLRVVGAGGPFLKFVPFGRAAVPAVAVVRVVGVGLCSQTGAPGAAIPSVRRLELGSLKS